MFSGLSKNLKALFKRNQKEIASAESSAERNSGATLLPSSIFEDIKIHLPKFLSLQEEEDLFLALKDFPKNIDSRLYSESCRQLNEVFQGDGFVGLPIVNLPDVAVKKLDCVLISNSCDLSPDNPRSFPISICYCPIFRISQLEQALSRNRIPEDRAKEFVTNIRRQRISQYFFLPKGSLLKEDSFIPLDKICSCESSVLPEKEISEAKIFSLSDYGFYLFLVKLSIHFTRVREYLNRDKGIKVSSFSRKQKTGESFDSPVPLTE